MGGNSSRVESQAEIKEKDISDFLVQEIGCNATSSPDELVLDTIAASFVLLTKSGTEWQVHALRIRETLPSDASLAFVRVKHLTGATLSGGRLRCFGGRRDLLVHEGLVLGEGSGSSLFHLDLQQCLLRPILVKLPFVKPLMAHDDVFYLRISMEPGYRTRDRRFNAVCLMADDHFRVSTVWPSFSVVDKSVPIVFGSERGPSTASSAQSISKRAGSVETASALLEWLPATLCDMVLEYSLQLPTVWKIHFEPIEAGRFALLEPSEQRVVVFPRDFKPRPLLVDSAMSRGLFLQWRRAGRSAPVAPVLELWSLAESSVSPKCLLRSFALSAEPELLQIVGAQIRTWWSWDEQLLFVALPALYSIDDMSAESKRPADGIAAVVDGASVAETVGGDGDGDEAEDAQPYWQLFTIDLATFAVLTCVPFAPTWPPAVVASALDSPSQRDSPPPQQQQQQQTGGGVGAHSQRVLERITDFVQAGTSAVSSSSSAPSSTSSSTTASPTSTPRLIPSASASVIEPGDCKQQPQPSPALLPSPAAATSPSSQLPTQFLPLPQQLDSPSSEQPAAFLLPESTSLALDVVLAERGLPEPRQLVCSRDGQHCLLSCAPATAIAAATDASSSPTKSAPPLASSSWFYVHVPSATVLPVTLPIAAASSKWMLRGIFAL